MLLTGKRGNVMSNISGGAETYLATHQATAQMLPAVGAGWLDRHRNDALNQFEVMGFPTIRDEQWKYTNVRPIAQKMFTPSNVDPQEINNDLIDAMNVPEIESYRLVFVDGIWVPQFSRYSDLPEGAFVNGLADLLRKDPARVKGKLGSVLSHPTHGFNAMNSAFVRDGAFVEISPGVSLDRPIELLYISSSFEDALVLPRNLVWLRSGSQATLIERYISAKPIRCLTNAVAEMLIEEDSKLYHGQIQEESDKSFHIGGLFAEIGRNASLTTTTVTLGGALVRNDLSINLNEEGAEARLHGLYVANGRQHIDNNIRISHNKPDTTSHECYKGILNGQSRGVFRGHVQVQQDAQRTKATQNNHNLMLSRKAEVDSMPQLEIYADDVKCTHGASIGQLEEDAVFYLQSRGVGAHEARQMLTQAFAAEALDVLEPATIREHLRHRVNQLVGSKK